jgi:starch synthase (maltosyl-transferring)
VKLRSALKIDQPTPLPPPRRLRAPIQQSSSVLAVTGRLVVEDLSPRTPHAGHQAKVVVGELVRVSATAFGSPHDRLAARALLHCGKSRKPEAVLPMRPVGNDEWEGWLTPRHIGSHRLVVEAWLDEPEGCDPASAALLTASAPQGLFVDRELALFGAWYELFPRSFGGFKGVTDYLPKLAEQGFDVVYLPPIHPIGVTARKGRNNTLNPGPDDPGSPWAIGNSAGGHTSIDASLGTDEDFDRLLTAAHRLGVEIALDYALQTSPDHPWVLDHPEWFHHHPDGSIACAENPPKVYQDIYPLNFWPDNEADREALWQACKHILDHWISRGVRVFRVDNPHTKPMAFWEWVIGEVKAKNPEVIFLAEAFTRPKVMARLAEAGFTQSYTYFTWRTAQHGSEGLWAYLEELAHGPLADYMRPNFWPNTPDILSGPLREGPPAAFALRLVLAATLSPSYGIYSGYELYENQPASEDNEEYLYSEKYELKNRDFDQPGTLIPLITTLNRIRRSHPALQRLRSIRFHPTDNDAIIAYSKMSDDRTDAVLSVVNLDPHQAQAATVSLADPQGLGLSTDRPYRVKDELSGESYTWQGVRPWVRLDPEVQVAHVFDLHPDRAAPPPSAKRRDKDGQLVRSA